MVPSGRRALRRRTLRPSVDKRGMMRPQQLVTLVALCGTVALVGSGTPRFGFDLLAIENTATPITDPDATRSVISLSAEIRPLDASPATAMDSLGQAATSDPDSTEPAVIGTDAPAASVSAESSPLDASLAAAPGSPVEAETPDPDMTEPAVALANAPAAETPAVEAPLPDFRPTLPPEKPVQLASASPSDGLNSLPCRPHLRRCRRKSPCGSCRHSRLVR